MRLFIAILKGFLVLAFLSGCAASHYTMKVNGEPITDDEVDLEMQRAQQARAKIVSPDRNAALDRLVKLRLALQQARHLKLDNDPAVRREMDKTLYSAFLKKKLAESPEISDPSSKELVDYYESNPWLRVRHLVLFTRTPEEKTATDEKILTVQEQLAAGVNFKELVLKYSQDDSVKTAGDLDFRGAKNLPDAIISAALMLKVGEISPPVQTQSGIHFIELLDKKNFADAPASYKEYLRGKLVAERRENYFQKLFADLQQESKIEYPANPRPLASKSEVLRQPIPSESATLSDETKTGETK